MKTGILLLARMGSKRLPGKHLLEVCGKPVVQTLIDRITAQFQQEMDAGEISLILATSREQMNQVFERLHGVTVFYGDVHNIPLRIHQAAQEYGLEQFILVDGDDILCSTRGMRAVYRALCEGHRHACTQDLPFGMNSQGFQTAYYAEAVSPALAAKILETGWGRVFPKESCFPVVYPKGERQDLLRFTLDYPEDLAFFTKILEPFAKRITTASDAEIIAFVQKNGLYQITEPIMKNYWERFHAQVREEDGGEGERN